MSVHADRQDAERPWMAYGQFDNPEQLPEDRRATPVTWAFAVSQVAEAARHAASSSVLAGYGWSAYLEAARLRRITQGE